ncbi:CAP domain-containing protein [Streptomyces sp. NRRL S-1022]|uniref:CAP domain-containing protein n=1 Tax=Streptomyces sp. NRRL S-1022 TaxID=1463880 RepID=UPI0004BFD812|nr:CAP domain-containing protein [Streptomyces sp. NRRL S-1022]
MGQHRKTKHYRRIVIAAAAVGAVGVPSVALACTEWPYGPEGPAQTVATTAPAAQWQYAPGDYPSNADTTGAPLATVPPAPGATASPSAPAGAPPSVRVTVHPHAKKHAGKHTRKKVTVHQSRRTAVPGTPQATAAASTAPAAPGTPKPAATPSTPAPAATASGVTAEILRLVNAERGKAGCQALTLNPVLTKAAQAHSEDMAAHQNMSHTGSDGSAPGDRITRAGYAWSSYGENVAYGYGTAGQVMAAWMSSPGHRANILNCGFKEIGVGLAQPGSYWTQDFGTAR